MTYSINTIKYTVRKVVEINGTIFKVRPFTTAEQLSMAGLKDEFEKIDKNEPDIEKINKLLAKIENFYVSLFDDKEKAKELFDVIPMNKYSDIYNEIMENASDDIEG